MCLYMYIIFSCASIEKDACEHASGSPSSPEASNHIGIKLYIGMYKAIYISYVSSSEASSHIGNWY